MAAISTNPTRWRWLFALGALVLAVLIFEPVGGYAFLNWDDDLYLETNPWLREGLSAKGVGWAFSANLFTFSRFAEYWSPLTLLTRLTDAQLFGIDAGAMHVTSVVLHCVNAVLLVAALRALTQAWWRPAVVGLLFLVHPLNIEPALWLSARKDVVAATFFFLTLLAYARYGRRPSRGRYAVLFIAFTGALMAKPMAVTIPALLLILDVWPLGRWQAARGDRHAQLGLFVEKAPLFLLAGIAAILAVLSQVDVGAMSSYPMLIRCENAVHALALYLRRTVWPSDLAIFYPHPEGRTSWLIIGGCLALLLAFTAAAWAMRKRAPFVLAGWAWFLVGVAPVIGIIQVGRQAMADRYFYTPGIGLLVAIVWSGALLLEKRPRRIAALAVGAVGAVALALAMVSAVQVTYWRDSGEAFTRALAVTERNEIAHGNLGTFLYKRGKLPEAREQFIASLKIRPIQFTAWNNLGAVEAALGHEEAALYAYERAVLIDPSSAKAQFNLHRLLAARKTPPAN